MYYTSKPGVRKAIDCTICKLLFHTVDYMIGAALNARKTWKVAVTVFVNVNGLVR